MARWTLLSPQFAIAHSAFMRREGIRKAEPPDAKRRTFQ